MSTAPAPRMLVTGASGFVGRALVGELRRRGFGVTAVLRHAGRAGSELSDAQFAIVGEIGPATDWREALSGVDTVMHLAAVAHSGIAEDAATAARYRGLNVEGTRRLAQSAAEAGVRRLVFLSSVKVNGERTTDRPFTESDAPAPEDIYGRSKREAEDILTQIAQETGLEAVVVRSPLVHGPGVAGNLRSLLALCDSPWPLPFGRIDGNRRSLIARANLVDALILCATHPAAAGETFLVRDGTDLSTATLIRSLRRGLGRPARLLPVPAGLLRGAARLAGRGAVPDRLFGSLQVDDTRIRQHLGWQPPVTAEAGLEEMARAFAAGRRGVPL